MPSSMDITGSEGSEGRALPMAVATSCARLTAEQARASALRGGNTGQYMRRQPLWCGRERVELLSVRAAAGRGQPPHGTVTVFDEASFRRYDPKRHPSDVQGTLKLTVHPQGISARWRLVSHRVINEAISARWRLVGHRVINDGCSEDRDSIGDIILGVDDTDPEHDKLFLHTVESPYAHLEVTYALFRNAVEAKVEVMLLLLDCVLEGEDSANIFGKIVACSRLFQKKIVLFDNEEDDDINVRCGHNIPLVRSVLAVPLIWPLYMDVDLRNSSGDEIARSDVDTTDLEFYPEPKDAHKKIVLGQNGRVEVRVTWSNKE